MKRYFVMAVAIVALLAVATPSFALDVKYGGLFRLRWESNDNVTDGQDKKGGLYDDNIGSAFDQRLRFYMYFIASENLRVVTKYEINTRWGQAPGGTSGGGWVGADATSSIRVKNYYVEFNVPQVPVRAELGVQGIAYMDGWVVDDDFSAAKFTVMQIDPFKIELGYIGAQNNNVYSEKENVDNWFLNASYKAGPFAASVLGFYQYGHDTNVSTWSPTATDYKTIYNQFVFLGGRGYSATNNSLFDLGLDVSYKMDWMAVTAKFIKNLGGVDLTDNLTGVKQTMDYDGYMIEAKADFFFNPFTFNAGGFMTSGDSARATAANPNGSTNPKDYEGYFRYPAGASHYWSEILGFGVLDNYGMTGSQVATGSGYGTTDNMGSAVPTGIWTINIGGAWQVLKDTKVTAQYYYIGTTKKALADSTTFKTSSEVGHEIDMYIDQKIVDGLDLKLVGAYLIAGKAYSAFKNDDNAYELGARLQWNF